MNARKSARPGRGDLAKPANLAAALLCAVAACGGDVDLVESSESPESPESIGPVDEGSPIDATAEVEAQIRELEALGYAGVSPADDPEAPTGVVHHDRERAEPGVNLLAAGYGPEAWLYDMDGRVLHGWHKTFQQVWPEREARVGVIPNAWRSVRLERNGDLFAIYEGRGLIKLDLDSNLLWSYDGLAHHALDVAADGRIHVLTRKARQIERYDSERAILEDFVTILAPDGTELDSISVLECFENAGPEVETGPVLDWVRRGGDVFHTNALQLLQRDWPEAHPEFRAGRVLVSILRSSHLALLDLDQRAVVWSLAGSWRQQHDPTLLEGGRLLLFDNRGLRQRSRVLELDPATGEVGWSYQRELRGDFYSKTCGASQRLAGGNTLITDTEAGRAFEVTRDGESVWEFRNPLGAGEQAGLRGWLFELRRLPPDFAAGFLD